MTATVELSTRLKESEVPLLEVLGRSLQKFMALRGVDPEMALVRGRRIAEDACVGLCQLHGIPTGEKRLDQLIRELVHAGRVPERLQRHLRALQDFGNYAAHASGMRGAEADCGQEPSEAELRICETSLCSLLDWMHEAVPRNVPVSAPFHVVEGSAISEAIEREACALDELVYDNPELRGQFELCWPWFRRNPEIYVMLQYARTGRVVGYIAALPLTDEYFEQVAAGTTIDMTIPASGIRRYDMPGFYRLYLASIVVHPDFQDTGAFAALFNAYTDKLLRLAERDIYIVEAIADAVTPQGHEVARAIGMEKLRETGHGSHIYRMEMLPPSLRYPTRSGRALMEHYTTVYNDLRGMLSVRP